MHEEPTTAISQRYLDAPPRDPAAGPIIRELLDRAVRRLRLLCANLLHRSYPRLTQPPLNLETDELLGGVVAGLLTALRTVRPQTVRQFFALATQHIRWQLNDLARRLEDDSEPLTLPCGPDRRSQGNSHGLVEEGPNRGENCPACRLLPGRTRLDSCHPGSSCTTRRHPARDTSPPFPRVVSPQFTRNPVFMPALRGTPPRPAAPARHALCTFPAACLLETPRVQVT
jgi:hypothetical protein